MNVEPTVIFYVTLFILIILEGIVIYLIWSYYKLLRSYDKVMSKQREMEQNIAQRTKEILEAAEQQASSIVATANTKASQLITQSQGFDQQTQGVIQGALQTFLVEQTRVYKQTFETMRADVLKYAQELNVAYRQRAEMEIRQVNEAFSKEMQQTSKMAQMSLAEAYRKVEAEVESYKKHRVVTVDHQLKELMKRVAVEVLHNSIEITNQEQLIAEALDEARKDHII